MSTKTIKAIAIILSAVIATTVVNILFLLLEVNDGALLATFISLLSAGFSLDIYERLNKRFADRTSVSE